MSGSSVFTSLFISWVTELFGFINYSSKTGVLSPINDELNEMMQYIFAPKTCDVFGAEKMVFQF